MIRVFKCHYTRQLYETGKSRRFGSIRNVAERKLQQLDSAVDLESLRAPPGNKLEALQGDRKGQHSIRINDQWRVCFVWTSQGPVDVEIVDYH
jgi:toxin HigB-1